MISNRLTVMIKVNGTLILGYTQCTLSNKSDEGTYCQRHEEVKKE